MFEEREQRHRFEPAKRGRCGEPRKYAGRRVGERLAAGIFRHDVPARQRGENTASERAVRRHQRRRPAVMHRLAQRNRDGERFVFGIGGFDHGQRLQRRIGVGREMPVSGDLPPHVGCRRRAQHFGDQALAAVRCGQANDVGARDADAGQQRLHGELRMRRRRCDFSLLVARDQLPRFVVEIGIEAGQHDGAVRQMRDRRDQFRGCRDRSGRAGGDDQAVGLARESRGFGLDQPIAPLGGLDAFAFAQNVRPGFDARSAEIAA